MQQMTLEATALLQTSHLVAWKIETLLAGEVTFSATTPVGYFESGSIRGDLGQETRRQMACTLVDPFYEISPFIDVYGEEIRIWRGVMRSSGQPELWSLGTFQITDVQNLRDPTPKLILRGMDRSFAVKAGQFSEIYVIPDGTNMGVAIQTLLSYVLPWLKFNPTDFSTLTPGIVAPLTVFTEGGDPWTECLKMAQSCGLDLFFDAMGIATLRSVPSVSTMPVSWAYIDGVNNTAVQIGARGIAAEAYSGSIVTAESTTFDPLIAIPRSISWDTDPTSPTYYLGAFGKRPHIVRSPLISTQAQADAMAVADMRFKSGRAKRVEFNAIPNPAYEVGDIIHVKSAVTVPPLDDLHVLENFVIPLKATELMSAGSRRRTMA
jgi:hypothetical protein